MGVSSRIPGAFPEDAALAGSSSPTNHEQLFLAQLADIERVIGWVCARRGLRGADAEDFASAVKFRLVENDYEILSKFQGRSSLRTYLTVVVGRLYLDYQVQRFGKWRVSAEARRLGPVAVHLERLIHRDGLTFDEACGVLQTGHQLSESREALYEMSLRLPQRTRRGASSAAEPDGAVPAVSVLEHTERQALAGRMSAVIRKALATLPVKERLFLRVHLVEGLTVAQASRSLGLEQRALYRRKEEIFKRLRSDLEKAGIGAADARELLSTLDWDADFFDEVGAGDTGPKQTGSRPSPSPTEVDRRVGDR
jgi:RNA polymerase sigma factor (sigma-70 family)